MYQMLRMLLGGLAALLIAGCAGVPPPRPAGCPVCPGVEPVKPAEKPLQPAVWSDLPGWGDDDPRAALAAFRSSCRSLEKRDVWRETCAELRALGDPEPAELRAWFERRMRPWQLVNPDGNREGLITGYYEPLLRGSRTRQPPYVHAAYASPEDMIVVELGELYPELKHMRLRGRVEGRRLVPYWSRADWSGQESRHLDKVLLWLDDPVDFFFMQIQGSGQVALDDGTRVRLGYADQNGHPYRSIGRWLLDRGELKPGQASMQNIKAWAQANAQRLPELLNANPSLVFFRELPAEGSGPPGAMGLALSPERSIAVDPRNVPLGAPVWLATTWPNEERPLQRLMLAQDTGGAIRGTVRADFYWGSGAEAGALAGRMRQKGRMWALMPIDYAPK